MQLDLTLLGYFVLVHFVFRQRRNSREKGIPSSLNDGLEVRESAVLITFFKWCSKDPIIVTGWLGWGQRTAEPWSEA